MKEFGPRISRGALARMTGATAVGLAVAPQVAAARRGSHGHLHRSSVLTDGRAGDVGMDSDALEDAITRRISAVAVSCWSASARSAFRCWISSNRRAFSMAMTAWSANISRRAIC